MFFLYYIFKGIFHPVISKSLYIMSEEDIRKNKRTEIINEIIKTKENKKY